MHRAKISAGFGLLGGMLSLLACSGTTGASDPANPSGPITSTDVAAGAPLAAPSSAAQTPATPRRGSASDDAEAAPERSIARDFDAFIAANDTFAREVDSKARIEGVEAAQKHFASRRGDLQQKFDAIKHLKNHEVTKEMTDKITKSVTDSTMTLCVLVRVDPALRGLCDDYTAIFDE